MYHIDKYKNIIFFLTFLILVLFLFMCGKNIQEGLLYKVLTPLTALLCVFVVCMINKKFITRLGFSIGIIFWVVYFFVQNDALLHIGTLCIAFFGPYYKVSGDSTYTTVHNGGKNAGK